MQRIYYQKSKVVQEEFKLIELTTLREYNCELLENIIKEVKEGRKDCDDAVILETFSLFNKVRQSTIVLIKAISAWQETFTKPIRPQLMECDYIIERMVKYIDFVNATKLRRIFNFQIFRGNILLLPFPNPKTILPIKVSSDLALEIKNFAFPNEEDIVFCYQFLINCLPEDFYKGRVVSLAKWLKDPWVPRVWIDQSLNRKTLNNRATRKVASIGGVSSGSGDNYNDRRLSKVSSASSAERQGTGFVSRMRTVSADTAKSGSQEGRKSVKRQPTSIKIKRRNQMLASEAKQILNITVNPALNAKDEEEDDDNSDAGDENSFTAEERTELERLDLYYQEMENLFLPKYGRREISAQVTGELDEDDEFREVFTRSASNPVYFLQSTQSSRKMLDSINHNHVHTEEFQRTEANLIAKRNRILIDRFGNKSGGSGIDPQKLKRMQQLKEKEAREAAAGTLSSVQVSKKKQESQKLLATLLQEQDDNELAQSDAFGGEDDLSHLSNNAEDDGGGSAGDRKQKNAGGDDDSSQAAAEDDPSATQNDGDAASADNNTNTDDDERSAARNQDLHNPLPIISKFSRRDSRRMSDLTVTFSVDGGDADNNSSCKKPPIASPSAARAAAVERNRKMSDAASQEAAGASERQESGVIDSNAARGEAAANAAVAGRNSRNIGKRKTIDSKSASLPQLPAASASQKASIVSQRKVKEKKKIVLNVSTKKLQEMFLHSNS